MNIIQEFKEITHYIWENDIKNSYSTGNICSERHLQSELYFFYKLKFIGTPLYKIWVEPLMYSAESLGDDLKNTRPDLIFTYDDQIIAILELKFLPHKEKPNDEKDSIIKDIKKLHKFNTTEFSTPLKINQDGKFDSNHSFKKSPETLYIFASIAREEHISLQKSIWDDKIFQNHVIHLKGDEKNNFIYTEIQ